MTQQSDEHPGQEPQDFSRNVEKLLGDIFGNKAFSEFAKSVHFDSLKLRVGNLIVEVKSPPPDKP